MQQSEPMRRWNDLSEVPAGFGPSVVTIGNFDGVHRGHLAVLAQVVELAQSVELAQVIGRAQGAGVPAVAVTFEPHPVAVLYPEHAPQALLTLERKLELLAGAGLDAVLVMPFTHELARWSPRRFVQEALVDTLAAAELVVGSDTRFGHRNAGDVTTLQALGAELGFGVHVVADLGGSGVQRRWSSTWIRELIAEGDVAGAAEVLGRPHRVSGEVVHGSHRGRELGYPTANLSSSAVGALPADGVYAGWLVREQAPGRPQAPAERLPAAISVGTNPTFDGTARQLEAYVLDRTDLDLYGEQVAVELVQRLRDTVRFEGIEPLIRQMAADVERTRRLLGLAERDELGADQAR